MCTQGVLFKPKPLPRDAAVSSSDCAMLWVLSLVSCVPSGKEKEFDRVMGLPELPRVVAIEQMAPEDRIDMFLYEMRTGRPARVGILTDLARSKPSIVPLLVARLRTDDADQLYPLLFLASGVLCTDVLLSPQANTERGRSLREAVLVAASRAPSQFHPYAVSAARAAKGECWRTP